MEAAFATYAGFEGDFHAGLTRPACVRVRNLHPKGREIRNTRQLSILSAEEMAQIATAIDLPELDPTLLGKGFKAAARGKRGVTAWVEREGPLSLGDELRLFVPNQPSWPHLG